MEPPLYRALTDKTYDKRKNAALDLGKLVRDAAAADDYKKLDAIVTQLCEMCFHPHANARSGATMGLAGVAISLGNKVGEYLATIVPPIFTCFDDPDSKVRYFACESLYNISKASKGEMLIFFNELFDLMAKISADPALPVKNGAELLDRLLKDIVVDSASTYVSSVPRPTDPPPSDSTSPRRPLRDPAPAFSLADFIPLLKERMSVLNPFSRNYLVQWLQVLDSVPELELVTYLPEFLGGLLKFLSDPTMDIRTVTQNLLAELLREIREIADVKRAGRRNGGRGNAKEEETEEGEERAWGSRHLRRASQFSTIEGGEEGEEQDREDPDSESFDGEGEDDRDGEDGDEDEEDHREWVPGQGVKVDHAAIVEILLQNLTQPDEEIRSTCLRWISEFLIICQPVMVPFTPRLIPIILSSLAHHVASIQSAANEIHYSLYKMIQDLPIDRSSSPTPAAPIPTSPSISSAPFDKITPAPSAPTQDALTNGHHSAAPGSRSRIPLPVPAQKSPDVAGITSQFESLNSDGLPATAEPRSRTVTSSDLVVGTEEEEGQEQQDDDDDDDTPFDFNATVNALTLQFLSDHEATRVAALEWLLMLHAKAPKQLLPAEDLPNPRSVSRNRNYFDGSENALNIALFLKLLSDRSEKVLRYDLQLLAQISLSSEDAYFPTFMGSLLSLFSTDRKLLETRGSLIIRQLCQTLNTERIYRTFAEILENYEDLEFASIMVQNLNLVMITSPELADFRKRLKALESKDGQALFTVLYRSWSHNAVATFSLCLLAQAYEQACALLQIFADLEITVSLLIQVDKLVQLLESPVFTSLRLQMLEPDRYPYLLKAMYGLLMLLPQSSAFATLRNRLSAVSSLGFLQTVPKSYTSPAPTSSTTTRTTNRRGDEIRWTELLTHFRQVQKRHSSAQLKDSVDSIDLVARSSRGSGTPPVPSVKVGLANGSTGGGGGGGVGGRTRTRTTSTLGRSDSTTALSVGPSPWRGASSTPDKGARSASPVPKRRVPAPLNIKKSMAS